MSDRLEYIDITRGAAMMLVVFGHMGELPYRMVFPFHMPLFFLLSGFFLKVDEDDKYFLLKKLRRLLLPYLFTAICIVIIHCIVDVSTGVSSVYDVIMHWIKSAVYGAGTRYKLPAGIDDIGAIWFLLALFWAFIFTKRLLKLNNKIQWGVVVLFCSVWWASTYMFKVWLPFSIQAGGVATGYVFLGYKAKKFKFSSYIFDEYDKLTQYGGALLILSTVVWVVEFRFGIFVSMARNYYNKGPVSVFGSLVISCGFIIMSLLFEKYFPIKRVKAFLKIWGKNSLALLCFHLIEMTFIPYDLLLPNISNDVTAFMITYAVKIVLLSTIVFGCTRVFSVYKDR